MDDTTTVSLPVNSELLSKAKEEGLDLKEVLERALLRQLGTRTATRIKNARADAWRKENAAAIEAWDEELRRNGLWSDDLRQF